MRSLNPKDYDFSLNEMDGRWMDEPTDAELARWGQEELLHEARVKIDAHAKHKNCNCHALVNLLVRINKCRACEAHRLNHICLVCDGHEYELYHLLAKEVRIL